MFLKSGLWWWVRGEVPEGGRTLRHRRRTKDKVGRYYHRCWVSRRFLGPSVADTFVTPETVPERVRGRDTRVSTVGTHGVGTAPGPRGTS